MLKINAIWYAKPTTALLTTSCSPHHFPQSRGVVRSYTAQTAPPAFPGTSGVMAQGCPLLEGASVRGPGQWPGSAAPGEDWGRRAFFPDRNGTPCWPPTQPVDDLPQGWPLLWLGLPSSVVEIQLYRRFWNTPRYSNETTLLFRCTPICQIISTWKNSCHLKYTNWEGVCFCVTVADQC